MAKQSRKQQLVKNQQGQGHLVEEIFDDNLLPDATEIEKLYNMDENILEWLKNTAEKEQEFRQKAYNKKIELVEKNERCDRQINRMGLTFSFIIVLFGLIFSAFLIYTNHEVLGSIFAGGILLAIIGSFLNKVVNSKQNPK